MESTQRQIFLHACRPQRKFVDRFSLILAHLRVSTKSGHKATLGQLSRRREDGVDQECLLNLDRGLRSDGEGEAAVRREKREGEERKGEFVTPYEGYFALSFGYHQKG
ncbi:hypothetical protein H105_06595 [Trichophyton soudanense CBS 452.61]|uniref:Uncharacterized protein n=1 Tax=Trichophyton soudanense CBS 452.61 TaxID=1215331 RepID=A0A022XLI8_TRISD|nr:hypothetical protein H105_06595 [Trichophyton soudanense CBS 452.61]